jgi:hypothetical protein
MSHCPITLATGQMPVPNFPGAPGTAFVPSGAKRGVVVLLHGISDTVGNFPETISDVGGFLPLSYQTLAENLQADGWVVVWPQEIGDNYITTQTAGWWEDCDNDTTNGARLVTDMGLWWDHAVDYVNTVYPGCPIVIGGVSIGGYSSLEMAIHKTSTLAGYFCQVPATLIWCVQAITPSFSVDPVTLGVLDSSMNGLTLPQSTITATSITGSSPSKCVNVQSGDGAQIVRYTSISGNQLLGCTGGDGTTTLATGGDITYSTFTSGMDVAMNALAGLPSGSQGTRPKGYLCYETGDLLVGYANSEQLGSEADSGSVTVRSVSGGGHAMSKQDAAALSAVPWVSGGDYVLNQFVISSSVAYQCKLAVSGSSTAPASDSTHWETFGGDAYGPSPTTPGWFHTVMDPICPAIH